MSCVHMGTEKNQAVHSKTGPETGRYGNVAQKLAVLTEIKAANSRQPPTPNPPSPPSSKCPPAKKDF